MRRWARLLKPDERIVWEGRPAPRAFTFRNWRWSLSAASGLVVLLLLSQGFWLFDVDYGVWGWAGLAVGVLAVVGHLVWARLEWERVFYVLTDQRLVAVSGLFGRRRQELPLSDLESVEQLSLGAALATVKFAGKGRCLTLHCLEHPQLLLGFLPPP